MDPISLGLVALVALTVMLFSGMRIVVRNSNLQVCWFVGFAELCACRQPGFDYTSRSSD